jgi:REP element-mobilizing transposase RayT
VPSAETYHITWTCYGQWLHGDTRGYIDSEHRTPGTPYEHNDPMRFNAAAVRMSDPACWLTDDQRRTTEAAIAEACTFRGWRLWTVNAQPDHVHVVVDAPEIDGKRVRHVLKDRATRALRGTQAAREHWWTEGGKIDRIASLRYLRAAVDYVNYKQPHSQVGKRVRPAASPPGTAGGQAAAGSGIEAGS